MKQKHILIGADLAMVVSSLPVSAHRFSTEAPLKAESFEA
jgi:hypothetical protein